MHKGHPDRSQFIISLYQELLGRRPEPEVFLNNFMGTMHPGLIKSLLPKFMKNIGGSLWLRKVALQP